MPSASSPAVWNERGPFIAPILIGILSWTGRANVYRPEYLKKSPSNVIAPSSRKVRITCMASFSRESGLRPSQSMLVLREQAEVAGRDHDLGAAAGELVERRHLLADQRRLAQEDVGDVRAEADVLRLARRGGEQHPEVLVPGLVDRVARVEPQLVRRLDVLDAVVERVVRQHDVAEPHPCSSSIVSDSTRRRAGPRRRSGRASSPGGPSGRRRSAGCPRPACSAAA